MREKLEAMAAAPIVEDRFNTKLTANVAIEWESVRAKKKPRARPGREVGGAGAGRLRHRDEACRVVRLHIEQAEINAAVLELPRAGYMTNNTEVDNRGNIYIVDRNGAGMDILQLTGCAAQIVAAGGACPRIE